MENKLFLITGGTSGVGNAVATGIAKTGAKVIVVSRNAANGEKAIKQIIETTGNNEIEFLVADLSLQSSIQQLCLEFTTKYSRLDGLINVAGALFFEKEVTKEGIDASFAINYLCCFALTKHLFPLLKKTGSSRIITVGGAPMYLKNPKLNLADLQLQSNYSGLKATTQAMFARMFFTFELAKQLTGTDVKAVAFHPGLITSNLVKDAPMWLKAITMLMKPWEKKECDIGVYLATANDLQNGAFYDDKKKIIALNEKYDPRTGEKLWKLSEALTQPYFN